MRNFWTEREFYDNDVVGTENADDTSDLPIDTEADVKDLIGGKGGNDVLRGGVGDDGIFGEEGFDNLYGGEGEDLIGGGVDDDRLFGGNGRDIIFGDEGDDILYGQGGFNELVGGSGNDTLVGLGEVSRDGSLPEIDSDGPEYYDQYTGGEGADEFRLRKIPNSAEGKLFIKGQKYALIKDFTPDDGDDSTTDDGDKIVLPGTADDYETLIFGENNENTAIYYTEDPDLDVGISLGPIPVSIDPNLAIKIPDQTALVAVLENATAGNLYNDNFYEFTG